jgi:ABC-type transport system involved in multi-copper enzyme maturation permease subunit
VDGVLTIAGLTLREAVRRRVLWALLALTVALVGLSGWGFSRLSAVAGQFGDAEQARLAVSQVLGLVLFGLSLIAALGTAFMAGPTLSGEVESGMALSVLARPVRRSAVLLGKWLGLAAVGCGYVVVAGLLELVVVRATAGYWPPSPVAGLALLAAQTVVLLTLGLLLSTVLSPMASGIVAVGLFGAAWVAGIVGGVGVALDNDSVARIGAVSRALLPTDLLWRGALHAFQDDSPLTRQLAATGFPFLADGPIGAAGLAWALVWVLVVGGLAAVVFTARDV